MEHNKPNWDKLQAISVLTSDSPKLGPTLKKNPYTNFTHKKNEIFKCSFNDHDVPAAIYNL